MPRLWAVEVLLDTNNSANISEISDCKSPLDKQSFTNSLQAKTNNASKESKYAYPEAGVGAVAAGAAGAAAISSALQSILVPNLFQHSCLEILSLENPQWANQQSMSLSFHTMYTMYSFWRYIDLSSFHCQRLEKNISNISRWAQCKLCL